MVSHRWWKNPLIVVPGIIAVLTAIIATAVPILVLGENSPEVYLIGVPTAKAGQEVTVSGKNLDLVSEVFLTQGSGVSFRIPFIKANETKLIVNVQKKVAPGIYDLEFVTTKGKTVSTGQKFTVEASPIQPFPIPDSPVSTVGPVSSPAGTGTGFQVSITEPREGGQVPEEMAIKGTTNGPLPQGGPVSIFPRPGGEGLNWLAQAYFGGEDRRGEEFVLGLVLTPPEVDQVFLSWFDKVEKTGEFYPTPQEPELLRMGAEIKLLITVTR